MADSNSNQNQRRTLWIMAAAGIFLLVVIGAAVILYSPAVQKKSANETGVASSDSFDPNDGWSDVGLNAVGIDSSNDALSDGSFVSDVPLSPFEADALGKTDETYSFNLDELKTFDSSAVVDGSSSSSISDSVFPSDSDSSKSSSDVETIDLNKISTSSNVSATNDFTAAQIESAKSSTAKSTSTSSSASSRTSSSSVSKSTTTSSKSSSGVPSLWVQVGSFEDVNKANNSRILLEENGYRNVSVLTYTADSKTMYRVRVGPYSNKADVESAFVKIKKMKQFNNSFIVDSNAPAVSQPALK